jgi:hypothetical protein
MHFENCVIIARLRARVTGPRSLRQRAITSSGYFCSRRMRELSGV